jgi:hypothetical protein
MNETEKALAHIMAQDYIEMANKHYTLDQCGREADWQTLMLSIEPDERCSICQCSTCQCIGEVIEL